MVFQDYAFIFKNLKDNLGENRLPDDFIAYFEFTFSWNEKDVVLCGEGDYSFGPKFYDKLQNSGGIDSSDMKY